MKDEIYFLKVYKIILFFQPNPLQGSSPPDHTVKYELFDRVINVREGFSVPLGARGTVIGKTKQCVEIY